MGKGGPMAFLAKKPWHPLNARNQEEIWKREQAYMQELEKRDEIKRKYEEEREKEGFDNFVAEATKQRKQERVEWMYQGALAAQEASEKRKEEYLLGKAVDVLPDKSDEPQARVDAVAHGAAAAPAALATDASANETWNRLNADPLLLMKRMEVNRVKAVTSNPYLVAQLKEQLRAARAKEDGSAADRRKREKKHKSKSKKEKRGKREPPRSLADARHRDGESPPRDCSPPLERSSRARKRSRPDAELGTAREVSRRGMEPDARDGSPSVRAPDGRPYDARARGVPREHHPHANSTDRGRANGADKGVDPHQRALDGASLSPSPRRELEPSRASRGHVQKRDGFWAEAGKPRRADDGAPGSEPERHIPVSRSPERDLRPGYGLQDGHVPEYAAPRRGDAELTRRAHAHRIAAREREAEAVRERAAAARRGYQAGRMSEAEREARRRDMERNAEELDQQRSTRIRRAHDAARAEAHRGQDLDGASFVAKAQQGVLDTDAGTLEGQLRRNRAKLER